MKMAQVHVQALRHARVLQFRVLCVYHDDNLRYLKYRKCTARASDVKMMATMMLLLIAIAYVMITAPLNRKQASEPGRLNGARAVAENMTIVPAAIVKAIAKR